MSNKKNVYSMRDFAKILYDIAKSDRDNNLGVGGFTGEGKSCFLTKLFTEYGIVSGVPWSFDLMTWSRNELMEWIDGKKDSKPGDGLRDNQQPEYSALLVDELFMLFYRRNWFDEGQIDSIATLNMCRDRHLIIGGNVPNFWDLDGAFLSRLRFYVYIPRRGIAWVFEQENNPFSKDPWNSALNLKGFRKNHSPYYLTNFLCEIHYEDWTPDEKIEYYRIRNKKRLMALDVNKSDKKERYSQIKKQRDRLIKILFENNKIMISEESFKLKYDVSKLTNKDLADVLGISAEAVRLIMMGER